MGSNGGDLSDRLHERWQIVPQGISAEVLAEEWGFSREDLDRFGLASHEKAARATREGRFAVAAEPNGAGQIICATGFKRGFRHDPLLARLVAEHGLETVEGWIVLAPDSTVPAVTDARRTLALAGAPGQWAFPAADTLVGAKYAARGFLRRVRAWRTR
jgi:acetyl-CoA acetyltransferase